METKIDLTKIAEKLQSIIEEEVRLLTYDDRKWQGAFNDLLSSINNEIIWTRNAIDEHRKNGLELNALESEGYLRAMIELKSTAEGIKNEAENDRE